VVVEREVEREVEEARTLKRPLQNFGPALNVYPWIRFQAKAINPIVSADGNPIFSE
jgi:hypothetical protein